MMYEIRLYCTKNRRTPVQEFIEELKVKSLTSKDGKIQYKQFSRYLRYLRLNGTHLS